MENAELLNEITAAHAEIVQAADALQALLGDLEAAPRAE